MASMLILCFLLVSVVSRSTVIAEEGYSFFIHFSPKSEAGTKRIVQLIIEEKEGEKESEKSLASISIIQSFKHNSARYGVGVSVKVLGALYTSGSPFLYLLNRSLRI